MKDKLEMRQPEELGTWLSTKPNEWAQMIACRAALRVLPLVGLDPEKLKSSPKSSDVLLTCFRANLVTWAVLKYTNHELGGALVGIIRPGYVAARSNNSTFAARAATLSAGHSARAAAMSRTGALAHYASIAVAEAADASAMADVDGPSQVWAAATMDAEWLVANSEEKLIDQSLWLSDVRVNRRYRANIPPWIRSAFDNFVASEFADQQGFKPWIVWYRGIIPNSRNAAPLDFFGEALTIRITHQPEAWWDRPSAEVNADIKSWMDGDVPANEFDRDLETALKNLPEQTPAAYRFHWRDNRITADPPDPSPSDSMVAQDLLDEARRKASEFCESLKRSNADPYVLRSVSELLEMLPAAINELRPGLLLSRGRTVEAIAAAFAGPDEERELFPRAIAQALDLSETVRDLQGCLPEIREIEAERLALEIDPRNVDEVGKHLEDIVEAAVADEEVVEESAKEALRKMSNESVRDAPTRVRQRLIADDALVVRNFLSVLFRGAIESRFASGVTGTTGEIWEKARPKFIDSAAEGLGSMGRPVAVVGVSALIWSLLGPAAGIVAMAAGFGRFDLLVKLLAKRLQDDRSDASVEPEGDDASLSD